MSEIKIKTWKENCRKILSKDFKWKNLLNEIIEQKKKI